MEQKEITITLTKDADISKAVSKAFNQNKKKQNIPIKVSKQQENGVEEGKLMSSIGEFRGIAG